MIIFLFVCVILGNGFRIIYDGIRVYVTLDDVFENKVKGLCGTFNYNKNDDFFAANNIVETSLIRFADSYKLDRNTPTPAQNNPCDTIVII
jgi:hypothetical protein